MPNDIQSMLAASKVRSASVPAKQNTSLFVWIGIGSGLIGFVIGFFAGREYLRYEFASAVKAAFKPLTNGGPFNPPTSATTTKSDETKLLNAGEAYETAEYRIELVRVTKDVLEKKGYGDSYWTKEKFCKLFFRITNKDSRKLLRFYSGSTYNHNITLVDDVKNKVQNEAGGMSEITGHYTVKDIKPEEAIEHMEPFEMPLEKTKYVTVSIDLSCVGDKGRIGYQIAW